MARSPQSDKPLLQVTDLLSDAQSNPLGGLYRRASTLLQLERLLAGAVEPALAGRFKVASVHTDRVVLLTPGAAWATRLRMQIPQLLDSLHRAGVADVRDIEVRVAPLPVEPTLERRPRPLSAAAEQALGFMARLRAKDED